MKNNEQHIIPFIERLLDGAEVEWKELDEVAEVKRGRRLVRKELSETGRYAVFQNSMTPLGFYNEGNVCGDTTFIICLSFDFIKKSKYSFLSILIIVTPHFFSKII